MYRVSIATPSESPQPKVIDLGGANVQGFAYVRVVPAEIDTDMNCSLSGRKCP